MIRIPRGELARIEAAALAAYPRECCGLLVGRGDFIAAAVETVNLAPAEANDRFEIDARMHLRLQRQLRDQQERIIGVFHSHPGGVAEPSAVDRGRAVYPGWVWLITAVTDGACKTRAYRHDAAGFCSLPLELTD